MQRNISCLVKALDDAKSQSIDPAPHIPVPLARKVMTGRPGRPKWEVNMDALDSGLGNGTPLSKLVPTFKGPGRRTLRRRMVETGAAEPGARVYVEIMQEDGSTSREYTSSTPPMSVITDDELDHTVALLLQSFPNHGRVLMAGALFAQGLRVSSARVRASLERVRGVPRSFGSRRLHRKQYYVPGANSLWHHDGQHGK
jgi:hypothetical protein